MTPRSRRIGIVLLAIGLAVVLAFAAALQRAPAVVARAGIDPREIAHAIDLLRAHDPRHVPPGRQRVATASADDIESLLDFGARRWIEAASRIELRAGEALVTVSSRAPVGPLGSWINVRARFVQTDGLPELAAVRLGRLPVPVWLAKRLAMREIDRARLSAEWQLATEVVRQVRFARGRTEIVYAWRTDSVARLMQTLLPVQQRDRLRAYSERLAELSRRRSASGDLQLAALIGPMFALARDRSARGGDPAAENTAAIVVLTLFATGRDLARVLPEAKAWPKPQPGRLLLAGRDDFPIHFLVSAALAIEGNGALSKALGLAKEVSDSRGGSGFSFNDIAANRAGERLGELAVAEPLRVQQTLAGGVVDEQLMPAWTDLPEFMPEPEFKRRFGGVGAPPYQSMMAEIDRRVAALPLR